MPYPYPFYYPTASSFMNQAAQQAISKESLQPVYGLVSVDSYEGVKLKASELPKNSVSEPWFLTEDNIFCVASTDNDGIPTIKGYRFEEIEIPELQEPEDKYATKQDLQNLADKIMEAINGQHIVPEQPEAE